ncbi:MAG TPA: uracil-DNA glycosylase [Chloroflexota bacterium]|nr:uracil-DNA glycosylase [Chloroflexota bacterium]
MSVPGAPGIPPRPPQRPERFQPYLSALATRGSSPLVANPYHGPHGGRRLDNLRRYLQTVWAWGPSLAIVGEAPGYRGCAVTGVPFTSRQLLSTDTGRWGLFEGYHGDAELGGAWAEATATVVWRTVLATLPSPPLLANAFPFHPHRSGRPASNRSLAAAELAEGLTYLEGVLGLFPGLPVVAAGRVAGRALARLGIAPLAVVRHPAHGGATAFVAGLRRAAGSGAAPDPHGSPIAERQTPGSLD